jgi:predicted membrane channel-forming protein YqfA (hemolysin III family)
MKTIVTLLVNVCGGSVVVLTLLYFNNNPVVKKHYERVFFYVIVGLSVVAVTAAMIESLVFG